MTKAQAKKICKKINAWVKRENPFEGGKSFGVDFATWCVVYPEKARGFCEAATVLTGKAGRYMPIALNQ